MTVKINKKNLKISFSYIPIKDGKLVACILQVGGKTLLGHHECSKNCSRVSSRKEALTKVLRKALCREERILFWELFSKQVNLC